MIKARWSAFHRH